MSFHEILFPLDIALRSAGGPQRRTELVSFGSGREARNARWADSRRRYDAGYGVKTLEALQAVVAFFEERRGQLYGFRWRDRLDHSSAAPGAPVSPLDQGIGTGDGATAAFQLVKTYGAGFAPYAREIAKPVAGSVRVAVAGSELAARRSAAMRRRVSSRFSADIFRLRAPRSPRGFCSTCRCGSTPTISKSICRHLRRERSRKFRWWRYGCDRPRAPSPAAMAAP